MSENNARDELRGTLCNTICNASNYTKRAQPYLLGSDMSAVIDKTVDAILAAGYRKPRTVTTVEELDALELRTVVHDSDGEPFELTDNGWRYWMYEESFSSLELSLPATVLYAPEASL